MKKKTLALGALMIMTALALTGCKNKVPEGYYTLESITEDDKTVKEKNLDDYGLDDSYAVFEDEGDGYLVIMGTPTDFTYNEKKSLIETGHGKISIQSDGKTVTLADGQVSMTFKKSKDDAPEKPGAVSASSGSDGSSPFADALKGDAGDASFQTGTGSNPLVDYWNADW